MDHPCGKRFSQTFLGNPSVAGPKRSGLGKQPNHPRQRHCKPEYAKRQPHNSMHSPVSQNTSITGGGICQCANNNFFVSEDFFDCFWGTDEINPLRSRTVILPGSSGCPRPEILFRRRMKPAYCSARVYAMGTGTTRRKRNHQVMRRAICRMRWSKEDVMRMKLTLFCALTGMPRLGRLSALNTSKR